MRAFVSYIMNEINKANQKINAGYLICNSKSIKNVIILIILLLLFFIKKINRIISITYFNSKKLKFFIVF